MKQKKLLVIKKTGEWNLLKQNSKKEKKIKMRQLKEAMGQHRVALALQGVAEGEKRDKGSENHVEIKQHSADQWINQKTQRRKNKTKQNLEKLKWKYNLQDLCDSSKVVIKGKFIGIQTYLNKQEKSQTT